MRSELGYVLTKRGGGHGSIFLKLKRGTGLGDLSIPVILPHGPETDLAIGNLGEVLMSGGLSHFEEWGVAQVEGGCIIKPEVLFSGRVSVISNPWEPFGIPCEMF